MSPDLILFPASYDARDVAGRLQARIGSTLMANVTDVLGPDKPGPRSLAARRSSTSS